MIEIIKKANSSIIDTSYNENTCLNIDGYFYS